MNFLSIAILPFLELSQYKSLVGSKTLTKPPQPIVNIIKIVHQTKWSIIKMRQQLNRSYKEVCAPMIDKCRFLLFEVRPAISLEQHALDHLHILHKYPRFKLLTKRIIQDMKNARKEMVCAKREDIFNVTIQSQYNRYHSEENLQKNSTADAAGKNVISTENLASVNNEQHQTLIASEKQYMSNESLLDINSDGEKQGMPDESKTPTNEKVGCENNEEFINNVISVLTEKSLIESYPQEFKNGINQQIIDFILYDLCDVETLRRAMFCQTQRYQIRKQGLDMFSDLLLCSSGLFDSVQYSLFNGFLMNDRSKNTSWDHILDNLNMITAFQKADILITRAKIIEWLVKELQKYVNQEKICEKQRHHANKDNSNLGTYVFLKKLPRVRFLLSILGILSNIYDANELSLIINSGILGTLMGLLRQTGSDIPIMKTSTDILTSVVYEDVVSKVNVILFLSLEWFH
jgi:E3 ubiquitin-protein ligase HERC2